MSQKNKKKKELVPVSLNVEEKELSFPKLIDNAINDGITFYKDHFRIQTGLGTIKYARTFFAKPSGFPRTVRIGWLEGFFTADDMDSSVHIVPFERTAAIKKLKDKIDELEAVYYSAVKNENDARAEETLQKIHDTKFLRDQIRNNQNNLYYASVQATLYADSYEDLNQKCVDVEATLRAESIELLNAYGRQKEGWISSLPLGRNFLEKSERNLDQLALTAMFPHRSSRLNHTGGIPIGVYGNEYVYFNQFDKKLSNYNTGIFGASGKGKSVFAKQLLGRGFSDGINRVLVLDVEPEYVELTKRLSGIVIELRSDKSQGTSSRINPLDVYVEKDIINKGTPNEYVVEKINLTEKIAETIEFFKVMKEACIGYQANLTPIELGVLNDIIERLYRERGITENPNSIFVQYENVDDNGDISWEKKYIEMPTITDVYNELIKEREEGYRELEELINIVKLFTKNKVYGMFDGQTQIVSDNPNVTLDDAPIITFDISRLSSKGLDRPLAQHVLMTFCWNRFVKNDPKTKKRIVVDEAWMMLQYKNMIEFLKVLSARGRKWNVSLTLISQRFSMFERNEDASDIIAQLGTVAFLGQSETDIEAIVKTFRFSEEVGQMIMTAQIGEVVLKAGKEIVAFMSEPTPDEWAYLNTNQNIDVNDLIKRY